MLAQLRRGVTWTYISIAIGVVIQLGVTAVTARLLDPAAFGLVAMANVLMRFGGYFAQMGVGRALIQRPEIGDDEVRAAFTSSTILGLIVGAVVILAAPLAAAFFKSEDVVPVTRWLALTFLASGLGATAQALLRRNLRFRASGFVEVAAYALGYGVPTLGLAFAGFGVWSLVAGAIGQSIVASGLAYLLTRHPVRPTFKFAAHRLLLGFGTKVSIISLLEFVGSTLDSAVIGRFGSAAQLGVYNRAFMLASLPTYHAHSGIAKVLFPVLAGGQADRAEFRAALRKITTIAIKILLPVGVGMSLAAPELVSLILGPKWTAATPLLAVLAVASTVNLLATFPGIALESIGALRGKAIAQAIYVIALATALLLVTLMGRFDLQAIVLVVAGAYSLRTIMYFMLGAIAGAYDPQALRVHLAVAIASVALTGALIGGSLVLAHALGFSAIATVAVAMAAGVGTLGLLFTADLMRLTRARGLPWHAPRAESIS